LLCLFFKRIEWKPAGFLRGGEGGCRDSGKIKGDQGGGIPRVARRGAIFFVKKFAILVWVGECEEGGTGPEGFWGKKTPPR